MEFFEKLGRALKLPETKEEWESAFKGFIIGFVIGVIIWLI